eukprot:TRINITY_DN13499_c0_g1_i1.p1 TRINITY_DN13499_c0_g1~~TRINITY_DN13499_c0_g1_i1.p1  ORF type:complete len:283 (-),score=41.85 TRINITY_DN13499_c0_g1_i1:95-943(-)
MEAITLCKRLLSLEPLIPFYDSFIYCMGSLSQLGSSIRTLDLLKTKYGKKVFIFSTDSLHTRKSLATHIQSAYNLTFEPSSIYLSNYLYSKYLRSLPSIRTLYCLGNSNFLSEFQTSGFSTFGPEDNSKTLIDPKTILEVVKERKIDAVVVGLDKEYGAYKVFVSSFAVELGARLMVTTRRINYEKDGDVFPDAGAVVAGIEVSTTKVPESVLEETEFPFEVILKENEIKDKTLVLLDKGVKIGKVDLDICSICDIEPTDSKYWIKNLICNYLCCLVYQRYS